MRHILVVEDSALTLKVLNHLFQQEPLLEPVFCASMAEAQLMLEASAAQFFAALVDLNLPDAPDGEAVDLVLGYHLPCIVLTGSCDERRRNTLLSKGVVDYIIKESQYSYEYAFRLLHHLERNRRVKILIAEDSETSRHFIRRVLTPHLYQIIDARDGNQALRILQSDPDIDLFLVDHGMPGICGFELVKLLRQRLMRHDLIIIGLSTDADGSLSARFIKQGADDFLRKPFCAEELSCRITSTLERRDLMQALKQAALHDSLTQLYNRRAFYQEANKLLAKTQRNNKPVSVAIIDLDHFKRINDSHGHAAGDAALVAFAQAIQTSLADCLSARLGGEEFVLLSEQPIEHLQRQLQHLRESCQKLEGLPSALTLSFSAGIHQGQGERLEQMLHQADMQLYQAKRQGRGRTSYRSPLDDTNPMPPS